MVMMQGYDVAQVREWEREREREQHLIAHNQLSQHKPI